MKIALGPFSKDMIFNFDKSSTESTILDSNFGPSPTKFKWFIVRLSAITTQWANLIISPLITNTNPKKVCNQAKMCNQAKNMCAEIFYYLFKTCKQRGKVRLIFCVWQIEIYELENHDDQQIKNIIIFLNHNLLFTKTWGAHHQKHKKGGKVRVKNS